MAQHVYTGNGAPPSSLQALPGSHYIDLDTGKQYLFGSAWVEGGGGSGGGLVYAVWDAGANYDSFAPNPAVATAYLVTNLSSNVTLNLNAIDPLYGSVTENSETVAEFDSHAVVALTENGSVLRLSLSGVTYDSMNKTLEPTNAADRLRLRITQLGAGLAPANRVVLVDATAVNGTVAATQPG